MEGRRRLESFKTIPKLADHTPSCRHVSLRALRTKQDACTRGKGTDSSGYPSRTCHVLPTLLIHVRRVRAGHGEGGSGEESPQRRRASSAIGCRPSVSTVTELPGVDFHPLSTLRPPSVHPPREEELRETNMYPSMYCSSPHCDEPTNTHAASWHEARPSSIQRLPSR